MGSKHLPQKNTVNQFLRRQKKKRALSDDDKKIIDLIRGMDDRMVYKLLNDDGTPMHHGLQMVGAAWKMIYSDFYETKI